MQDYCGLLVVAPSGMILSQVRCTLRTRYTAFALLLLLTCLLPFAAGGKAQEEVTARYFPQTAHTLTGAFLEFYEMHGGLRVFGYPLTERFFSDVERRWVQYCQNGRLELDPQDNQVRPSLLPIDFARKVFEDPIPERDAPLGSTYYSPTGHSVAAELQEFYERNGGPAVFGYPISELVDEGDRLVQYFERMVIVWCPEMPSGLRVQLAPIGDWLFRKAGHDLHLLEPTARIETITEIKVGVTVSTSVMGREGGKQLVYIYVTDQFNRPLKDVWVALSVVLPQDKDVGDSVFTDADGIAKVSVEIPALAPGETVPIQVQARHKNNWESTATSFRIWW